MTSQTLTTEQSLNNMSGTAVLVSSSEAASPLDSRQSRLLEAMKTQYRLDQQMKFLNLQAETESLLQQLKAIKEQRQTLESATLSVDPAGSRTSV